MLTRARMTILCIHQSRSVIAETHGGDEERVSSRDSSEADVGFMVWHLKQDKGALVIYHSQLVTLHAAPSSANVCMTTVCGCGHVHCGKLYHHHDGQRGCSYEPGEEYYCGFYEDVKTSLKGHRVELRLCAKCEKKEVKAGE